MIQILNELTENDNTHLTISTRRNVISLLIFPVFKIFKKYLEVSLNKIIFFFFFFSKIYISGRQKIHFYTGHPIAFVYVTSYLAHTINTTLYLRM